MTAREPRNPLPRRTTTSDGPADAGAPPAEPQNPVSASFTLTISVGLNASDGNYVVDVTYSPFINAGKDDWVGLYESEADLRSDIRDVADGGDGGAYAEKKWVTDFDRTGDTIYWSTSHSADAGWVAGYFAKDYASDKYRFIARSRAFGTRRILPQFEHIVVLMDENRSLDNLLGYLYKDDQPKYFLPAGSEPVYQGLQTGSYSNQIGDNAPVYASEGTDSFYTPTPDPGEEFDQMTFQIFGNYPQQPNQQANMSGFLQNYYSITNDQSTAAQIMQSYSPDQVPVISKLAKSFAVSDQWFASMPCQTWPNRGFVHSGSSDGYINNSGIDLYTNNTIYNLLYSQDITWSVYRAGLISLTFLVFYPVISSLSRNDNEIDDFYDRLKVAKDAPMADKIPSYSFLEPKWIGDDRDESYHPPHDVQPGEEFLSQVYEAIRNCPYRDKILFVLLFDEHGGTYDHVPPPDGAKQPSPYPESRDGLFDYTRYGVRVPAIVVSSYTAEGGVFRSPTDVPYDHTSILATLRDWYGIDSEAFKEYLPSPRIESAPTLDGLFTLSEPRDWPEIKPSSRTAQPPNPELPVDEITMQVVIAYECREQGRRLTPEELQDLRARVRTRAEARAYLLEKTGRSPQ